MSIWRRPDVELGEGWKQQIDAALGPEGAKHYALFNRLTCFDESDEIRRRMVEPLYLGALPEFQGQGQGSLHFATADAFFDAMEDIEGQFLVASSRRAANLYQRFSGTHLLLRTVPLAEEGYGGPPAFPMVRRGVRSIPIHAK